METKIADALRQDFDALQQVRSVRAQLKNLLMPAKSLPGDVSEAINALEKTLAASGGRARPIRTTRRAATILPA